jgi:ankyrin repeat protein
LHVAAYRNHPAAVTILLKAGAAPMQYNNLGENALEWSILRGYTEVQRILEEHGATSDKWDRKAKQWRLNSITRSTL